MEVAANTNGSTTSSMTSTSHTMTVQAAPPSTSVNSSLPSFPGFSGAMVDLLASLAPRNRHVFVTPSAILPTGGVELVKHMLDPIAGRLSEEGAVRLKEARRRKRKFGQDDDEPMEELLRVKRLYVEGFEVQQVWEQARKVIDCLKVDVKRSLRDLEVESDEGESEEVVGDGVNLLEFDEDGFEVGSDDGKEDGGENGREEDYDDDEEEDLNEEEELESGENLEGLSDMDDDESDEDPRISESKIWTEDPNGLNDGFFSIDEFNKMTNFLEQQDAAGDLNTGEASDEEDVDWDANPLSLVSTTKAKKSKALDMDEEDLSEDEDDDEDEIEGPTFGNMDLDAPEGESDEEEEEDEAADKAGDNTNDILYKDFFEQPARKMDKGERQDDWRDRQMRKSKQAEPEDENTVQRAMADVRRDLFDDESDHEHSEDALSDLDPADPKSRRSAHERKQAKLVDEIRRLEAASVQKREWTLSGEARAADRPMNSLLEEDLDFERTGKPVPVITAEVSENIEELIKRRILAEEFDEVLRRRPDEENTTRRGMFELSDSKNDKSLAELYEEEHVKRMNPDTYVSAADAKVQAEEQEISQLWKEISGKLDALSSWHYKPKPPVPSLTIVADTARVTMEDAQPTTASGLAAADSMLAPQEIYKAGQDRKAAAAAGEIVPRGGAPVARTELTREEKLRRRRREKERFKKQDGDGKGKGKLAALSDKRAKQKETLGELKRAGVKVIGRRGDIRDVEGNKIKETVSINGAGGFKL